MAGQNKIIRLNPIRGGLNTTVDDESRPADQAGKMRNFTRMRTGGLAVRNGYQAVANQYEASNEEVGIGLAEYSYQVFDDSDLDNIVSSTVDEIVLFSVDDTKRLKKQTLTITETLASTAQVSISPRLDGTNTFLGYKLELKNSSDVDQLSQFNGSSKDIDISASWSNGSTETVADDLAWSLHFQVNLNTLPGGGNFYSVVGNTGASSNFERVDIDSSGNVFLFDKSNNSVSWSTGFSTATDYKCTIVCDGTNSSNLDLYVDSTLVSTATQADSEITLNFIGQKGDASQYFDGSIEWLALYDREVTTAEIATLEAQTDFPNSPQWFDPVRFYYFTRRVNTSTGEVTQSSGKTLTDLKDRIDNEPSFSATIEDGTPKAEFIPMVVDKTFSGSTEITYYLLETINIAQELVI